MKCKCKLIYIFMFYAFFFLFTGCKEEEIKEVDLCLEYGHELFEEVFKEATCTEKGKINIKCKNCGYLEVKDIPLLDHNIIITEGTTPTCTIKGLTEGTSCSICGEVFIEQLEIEKLDHEIKAATCNEPEHCTNCDYIVNPPLGCIYKDGVCVRCGKELEKDETLKYSFDETLRYYIVMGTCDKEITEITIPNSYNGYPVKEIASRAFAECEKLKTVVIEEGIERIGYEGFVKCLALENITFPSSLQTVDHAAFFYCEKLENVYYEGEVNELVYINYVDMYSNPMHYATHLYVNEVLLENVVISEDITELKYQFYSIEHLKSIVIPKSVITISEGALCGCDSLERLEVPFLGLNREDTNGKLYYLFNSIFAPEIPENLKIVELTDTSRINKEAFYHLRQLEEVILPPNLEVIGESAFFNCNIKEIKLPATLKRIEKNGLSYSGLENVILPANLEFLGEGAFSWCGFKTFTMPYNIEVIEKDVFYQCEAMIEFTFPNGIKTIEESFFRDCERLVKVNIPDSVEEIKYGAFAGCTALTTIDIPESTKILGDYVFSRCTSLSYIYISKEVSVGEKVFNECNELMLYTNAKEFNINLGVGQQICFCDSKMDIIITNEAQYLISNGYAILNKWSGSVANVVVPKSITVDNNDYEIKEIRNYAFRNCSDLEEITIPENIVKIGTGAFQNCEKLTKVVINASITKISDRLFNECGLLESVILPETVQEIGKYSFYNCKSIKSINIPNAVTIIDDYAFWGMGIIEINLPLSLERIGESFYSDNGMVYNTYQNGLYLGNVDNPYMMFAKVENDDVKSCVLHEDTVIVNNFAFNYNYSQLEELIIKENVKFIGKNVVASSAKLKILEVPFLGQSVNSDNQTISYLGYKSSFSNLERIVITKAIKLDDRCFENLENLEEIILPDTISEIGSYAFSGCTSLKHIKLPPNIEIINAGLFKNCTSLEEISIPNRVKIIENEAFYNTVLINDIYLSNNIIKLGEKAFYNMTNLQQIVIPDSVETIGEGVLANCNNLKILTIPFIGETICSDSVLGYVFGYDNSSYHKSYLPKFLENVIITKENELSKEAFKSCTSITDITISKSVMSFGDLAFEGCDNLINVYYGGTIEDWCKVEFAGKTANPMYFGEHLYILNENSEYYELAELVIPKSINSIGNYQFIGMDNVISVIIHDNVEAIGENVFEDCINIEKLETPFLGKAKEDLDTAYIGYLFGTTEYEQFEYYLPKKLNEITITYYNGINGHQFYKCENLKTVYYKGTIDDWCNIIFFDEYSNPMYYASDIYLFDDNNEFYELTEIIIPNTVEAINEFQFYGFDNVTKVYIPDSVTRIGYCSFKESMNIRHITLPFVGESRTADQNGSFGYIFGEKNNGANKGYVPDDLEEVVITGGDHIGSFSFYGCKKLNRITIPSTVKKINSLVFYECDSLETVYYNGKLSDWLDIWFANEKANPLSQTNKLYMLNDNNEYQELSGTIIIPNQIDVIQQYAFMNSNLKEVIFSDSVTKIEEKAFSNCEELEKVTFGKNIVEIEAAAFHNCTKLNNVVLPEKMTVVEDYVFSYCSSLTNVIFPSNLTKIGIGAFYNCENLTNVIIPNTVTFLSTSCFEDCKSISSIFIPRSVELILANSFLGCVDIIIYCERELIEIAWEPGWNGGGKVLYGQSRSEIV